MYFSVKHFFLRYLVYDPKLKAADFHIKVPDLLIGRPRRPLLPTDAGLILLIDLTQTRLIKALLDLSS